MVCAGDTTPMLERTLFVTKVEKPRGATVEALRQTLHTVFRAGRVVIVYTEPFRETPSGYAKITFDFPQDKVRFFWYLTMSWSACPADSSCSLSLRHATSSMLF